MFLKTKNRKALSAVLTTLIILVASVVLGTGVVLFGTSLFQTNSQSSGLTVQGVHVWINAKSPTTYAWGAAEIRNSGDKILSVDQIQVRGQQIPYSSWYFDSNSSRVTAANFQSQLAYTGTATSNPIGQMASSNGTVLAQCQGSGSLYGVSNTLFAINEFGSSSSNPTLCFVPSSGPISMKPGDRAVVYFQVPNGILSTVDGGSNSNVAIYSGSVGSPQSVTIQSEQN